MAASGDPHRPHGADAGGLPAWEAYLLVFSASLCTLVLEIVAGRVLAPTIGVSLYTWTSVIGVVLAGAALGSWAGGAAARRNASAAALAGVLLAAGVTALLAAIVSRLVPLNAILPSLPPLARVLTLVAGFFFVPCALLGAVTPLVAQLVLRDRAHAGSVVGRLGAAGATGSIAGTFLAGFALIPAFGSRTILLSVAATLALLAIFVLWLDRRSGGRSVSEVQARLRLPVLVVAAATLAASGGLTRSPDVNWCTRETAYYCTRLGFGSVGPVEYVQVMHDRAVQGYTSPSQPRLLVAAYTQVLAEVAMYQAERGPPATPAPPAAAASSMAESVLGAAGLQSPNTRFPLNTLFIGGGSYTLPLYLADVLPGSELRVFEIDPAVTDTAARRLGLGPHLESGAVRVTHGDARLAIARLPESQFDLVVGDAFSDLSVPWHLSTAEFARDVRRVLREDGVYATNVIDRWPNGAFLASFVRTVGHVFPHVALMRVQDWDEDRSMNWVVIGANQPLDQQRLAAVRRPAPEGDAPARGRVLPAAELEQWLAGTPAPALTDDYAPADALLAPMYLGR
jgi:spermidine synthase